jgi:hypothetical protein
LAHTRKPSPPQRTFAKACEEADYAIPLKPLEIRHAGRFLIVEDPDGNWVEFAEYADA